MKKIPKGFIKMDLQLTLQNEQVKKFEDIVLSYMLSIYYIYYTKIPKFDGKTWTEFHFYCRPNQAQSIAYRMGCLAQTILQFHTKKKIINFGHCNPKNFPACIHIDINPERE